MQQKSIDEWVGLIDDYFVSQDLPRVRDEFPPTLKGKDAELIYRFKNLKHQGNARDAYNLLAPHFDRLAFQSSFTRNVLLRCARILEVSQQDFLIDAGCGVGIESCFLAKAFPKVRILGVDLSRKSIDRAQQRSKKLELANLTFNHCNYSDVPAMIGEHTVGILVFNQSLPNHHDALTQTIHTARSLLKIGERPGIMITVTEARPQLCNLLEQLARLNEFRVIETQHFPLHEKSNCIISLTTYY